jgi:hypothetical protein
MHNFCDEYKQQGETDLTWSLAAWVRRRIRRVPEKARWIAKAGRSMPAVENPAGVELTKLTEAPSPLFLMKTAPGCH